MTPAEAEQLDVTDSLAFTRERFELPDGRIYLDGNSLGALPRSAPRALTETAQRQWGQDLIASWTKHNWIDWPTQIATKLAPIVNARPSELLIADFNERVPVQASGGGGARARPGRSKILTQQQNFPTDLYVAHGVCDMLGLDAEGASR